MPTTEHGRALAAPAVGALTAAAEAALDPESRGWLGASRRAGTSPP